MKAEYVNPFIAAFSRICESQFSTKVDIGKVGLHKAPVVSKELSVVIGVTADMTGQVIFAMNESTAKKVCSLMMMGMEVAEIDDMARSALKELFNWVCGHAAEEFLGINPPHTIDITPPMFNVGSVEMYVAAGVILLVPLHLAEDTIYLYVSLVSKV